MHMDRWSLVLPQRRTLIQALLLAAFTLTFAGYMIADFDHPPSHTHGGVRDCGCPGDWAPDPGSLPSLNVSRGDSLAPLEFVIPGASRIPATITGPAWWDDQLPVPEIRLASLPSPFLLI